MNKGEYMRQAIVTKYLGPTNHRGSRVKAKCLAKTITVDWQQNLDVDENHYFAAHTLAKQLDWLTRTTMHGGALPDQDGYCFVFIDKGENK